MIAIEVIVEVELPWCFIRCGQGVGAEDWMETQ